MLLNRVTFALLGALCVAAAAGGGYLAIRQNAATVASSAAAPAATPAPVPAKQVQETEAAAGGLATRSQASPAESATNAQPIRAKRNGAPIRPAARPARPADATRASNDRLSTPERSWPSAAASTPPPTAAAPSATPTLPAEAPAPVAHLDEPVAPEPPPAPQPPEETLERTFDELVVSADSVIGLQTESPINSERARLEDRVEARVVRDVRVGSQVAIPAGARTIGSVVLVERGGKFKERARLGIRFHTLVLADGSRLPITTETIYRDGEAPGNSSAAKIGGGAVAGAILGAIIGGSKGATVGATSGAGAGTAAVMAGNRSLATLPAGTEVTARILSPVTVTIEK
jgi:hypothetical protein